MCRGTLVVEKDGKQYSMYGALISGGSVSFDADWEAEVEEGDWLIDRDALAPELQDDWRELEALVMIKSRTAAAVGVFKEVEK